jgi:hypothetical protein
MNNEGASHEYRRTPRLRGRARRGRDHDHPHGGGDRLNMSTNAHKAAYRERNREMLRAKNRAYKAAHPEKVAEQRKRRWQRVKAVRPVAAKAAAPVVRDNKQRRARYASDPAVRAACIERAKKRAVEKREEVTRYKREWSRKRQRSDPLFRLARALRKRVWIAFNRRSWTKRNSVSELIGADWSTVSAWIEERFKPGMCWKNYGSWHLDHVKPLASAKSEADLLKLFHYTNLQPLWAVENLSKGARRVD